MTPLPLAANAPPSGSALSDLGLATLVVAVIVMMALPLPAWSLDMLVAVNIALAVLLLLVALFIPTPLAFSTFPAVLLVTTLFRISLNVATTRQILLHAHAGDIIAAFGRLVVGGSLVVGLVVFLIITVVQFIVVAKGAERVAEVSARFTLDAMPGKQMSIDADLRAGMLSQAEAVQRRRELVQESQFYGAMDGAMKFVKGDAIAGIVIVLVNLLGGIAIGTLSMGLGFGAAVQKFSVLSIGDGLVTQIPALFVSIAAGIAITRTAPDGSANLGQQIGRQLGGQPRALLMSAGVMVLFAGVPGFPTFTFLGLAALLGVLGVTLTRTPRAQGQQRAEQGARGVRQPVQPRGHPIGQQALQRFQGNGRAAAGQHRQRQGHRGQPALAQQHRQEQAARQIDRDVEDDVEDGPPARPGVEQEAEHRHAGRAPSRQRIQAPADEGDAVDGQGGMRQSRGAAGRVGRHGGLHEGTGYD